MFREKPQQELSLLIGIKGRRHYDIAPGVEHELVEDTPLVDEDAGGSFRVDSVAAILPVLLHLARTRRELTGSGHDIPYQMDMFPAYHQSGHTLPILRKDFLPSLTNATFREKPFLPDTDIDMLEDKKTAKENCLILEESLKIPQVLPRALWIP